MKYLLIILLLLLSNKEINEVNTITDIAIYYEGDMDKPFPKIIFCKSCNDNIDFRIYQFKMDDDFFKTVNIFLLSSKHTEKKEGNTVLSVTINNNGKRFLKKNDASSLIKIIEPFVYSKNSKLLNSQLNKYDKILN
ncbi:hypothetical protein [Chryseobacterium piperi]|nr:hypothetical protein [Chryseobacterium piperi]